MMILCSCGKAKVDLQESVTVLQTESTTASETETTSETVTSETLLKVDYDMIPLLERPTYSVEASPMAMPEDMEFTLDLKDITPETDLFALTNMEKHNIGETFTVDLDCDGTEEEISIEENFYDCEGILRVLRVIINGTEYNLDRSHDKFMNVPTGIFTCDIDSSDNYIEIACTGSCATNDFLTKFYRYENGELRRIFEIRYDTPDGNGESDMFFDKMNQSVTGKPIITDGSGVITAERRLDFQTWLAYSHYVYNSESGEISFVCEPVYPYYYENINSFDMAMEFTSEWFIPDVVPERSMPKSLKEITLYKEPDLDSDSVTLAPQRVEYTAEYYYSKENPPAYGNGFGAWVYVTAEDGTSGWHDIKGDTENILSGRVLYD